MTSFARKASPHPSAVRCTQDEPIVSLADGRVLSVPLAWFPRLAGATAAQLANFELLGDGEGIHWPAVDEDVSVAGLLRGQPSLEFAATKT
ncbi:MAG: DUF2442 domain-containing protein [Burkholderiaceae bacterium]|jgi:hypothetical protein|nr:MAG: DUF2442 domain-containing protein [Burkholderiaceae bacterium]